MSKSKIPHELQGLPWITPEGDIDLSRFPLETLVRPTLDERDAEGFGGACRTLASRAATDMDDAVLVLLGLLRWYQNDLERLYHVVDALRTCRSAIVADALMSELRRVKSTNASRKYLRSIIEALESFPREIRCERFEELSSDKFFSYKMRSRFRALADGASYRDLIYGGHL